MNDNLINNLEYTVSELSNSIKRIIEDNFDYIRIKAEIGRVSKPNSGHIYLDLKDDTSVISGIVWKGNVNKLDIIPEEGLEVVCTGKVTTYSGQSKYQIIIENMEPAGIGALMALLEKRKDKLLKEGLFDDDYKKDIPFLPKRIGVITSPTGAVIKDILHRIHDRFPVNVTVWPVKVQGESSSEEVIDAIEGFHLLEQSNLEKPDVIIIARGGGSIEDLWGFNDEDLVRKVFESKIPIISAIGHEVDYTISDFVADKRASTPSDAAEIISSLFFKSYPILLLFTCTKNSEPLCSIVIASCSIICPLLKNIKSFSLVAVNPLGADAVTAAKLAVLTLMKLPV